MSIPLQDSSYSTLISGSRMSLICAAPRVGGGIISIWGGVEIYSPHSDLSRQVTGVLYVTLTTTYHTFIAGFGELDKVFSKV